MVSATIDQPDAVPEMMRNDGIAQASMCLTTEMVGPVVRVSAVVAQVMRTQSTEMAAMPDAAVPEAATVTAETTAVTEAATVTAEATAMAKTAVPTMLSRSR